MNALLWRFSPPPYHISRNLSRPAGHPIITGLKIELLASADALRISSILLDGFLSNPINFGEPNFDPNSCGMPYMNPVYHLFIKPRPSQTHSLPALRHRRGLLVIP